MQLSEVVRASDVSFNEGVLRLAAVHGRKVEFRYAKSSTDPVEFRTLVPDNVYTTRAGATVIVGEDDDRAGTRSYRLDRILGDVAVLPA